MFSLINSWGCCKYIVTVNCVAVTGLKLQKWSKASKKLNSKKGMETVDVVITGCVQSVQSCISEAADYHHYYYYLFQSILKL